MPRIEPFEKHTDRYEAWFERHDAAYLSELLALRPFVPLCGRGLEIGVGSGRFAAPLGVQVGIDPSKAMLDRDSALGRRYEAHREESVFYRDATFYCANDVERLVSDAGFSDLSWAQTLSHSLEGTTDIEPVRPGRGESAFVVLQARNDKPSP